MPPAQNPPAAEPQEIPNWLTTDDLRFMHEWKRRRQQGIWRYALVGTILGVGGCVGLYWLASNLQRHGWQFGQWQNLARRFYDTAAIWALFVLVQRRGRFVANERRFHTVGSALPACVSQRL